MNSIRKFISAFTAVTLCVSLAACADTEGGGESSVSTTPGVTVAINTETLKAEDAEIISSVTDQLRDVELENKTIKWLSHYDRNPSSDGRSRNIALEMFDSKYGGKVEWYPTTWDARYNDLSTMVLGGEGIDFFAGDDTANFPGGIVSGMFEPVDEYIDMESPLWQKNADAMELFNFGGKHYEFVTNVTAECVVIYNKATIEANGLDDPYELWKAGEWNWDTFKAMLLDFVDEDADQWGLDGFWAEKSLFLSAGVPLVNSTDEGLVCNINDATVEKAMNYQYDLYTNGLVFPREQFAWTEHPEYMGEGRQLFYLCGTHIIQGDPETWKNKIPAEDVMIAPVPSPADSDKEYQGATIAGFALCKGAANPLGVALYAECEILASMDEEAIAIGDQKLRDDNKWTEELITAEKEINELARQNPVVDLSTGCSTDIRSLTTDGGDTVGTRAALHGVEWAPNREALADTLILLVGEVDAALKAKQAE